MELLSSTVARKCELNLWGIETPPAPATASPLLARVNWTCEGLKQQLSSCWKISGSKCELNLWGIETVKPAWSILFLDLVWIEPVRDWNNWWSYWAPPWRGVWIEPVRDWNINSVARAIALLSVNWTCEGLKRYITTTPAFFRMRCELNLWGIETRFN